MFGTVIEAFYTIILENREDFHNNYLPIGYCYSLKFYLYITKILIILFQYIYIGKKRINKIQNKGQIFAEAPPDEEFLELETIDHEEIYDLIALFIKKAIPVKNVELTVINGLTNRTAPPKAPLVLLQILEEEELSTPQTRYTDTHKIISNISQLIIQIDFYGNKNVRVSKMAKAFSLRFNDAWASEQFAQYSNILFPLYSEKIKNRPLIEIEDQFADFYSVTAYFEYHPEVGMCQDSAKELRMTIKPTL